LLQTRGARIGGLVGYNT